MSQRKVVVKRVGYPERKMKVFGGCYDGLRQSCMSTCLQTGSGSSKGVLNAHEAGRSVCRGKRSVRRRESGKSTRR